jgi:outer membrane immunogenic protein
MKFSKYYLLASASGIALASGANAADLPIKSPSFAAPPAPASWAGWYVGINGGVITNQTHVTDPHNWTDESYIGEFGTAKATGGAIGGQIGYNWQDDAFVYGLEADIDWVSAKASNNSFNICPSCTGPGGASGGQTGVLQSNMEWLSTIRGRAGITVGRTQGTLLYVTGGLALAGIHSNWGLGYNTGAAIGRFNPNSFVSNGVKVGWTAGVGIEHMFASIPNWSFRAEALWIEFANDNVTVPGPSTFNGHVGPFPSQFQNQSVLGRVGVNYRF